MYAIFDIPEGIQPSGPSDPSDPEGSFRVQVRFNRPVPDLNEDSFKLSGIEGLSSSNVVIDEIVNNVRTNYTLIITPPGNSTGILSIEIE